MEEENSAVLYPHSTTSSDTPIVAKSHLPNTFTDLRQYLSGLKPPPKGSDLVY